MKISRCEDEKMFYRPQLLEEPCAQTLSGKKNAYGIYILVLLATILYYFKSSIILNN